MAASERGCCVPGCGKTRKDGTVLHSFPDSVMDKNRYLTWIQLVGLDESLDPQYVCKNRRVCHDHFETKYLTWSRRLSHGAIPTLSLPGSEVTTDPLMDITNKPEDVVIDAALPSTSQDKFSVAYVTVPNKDVGKTIAHGLVKNKLAACVNIIPEVTSIYEWKDEINEDNEALLMIKTRTSQVDKLTEYVRSVHPYEVCEVISLPIKNGNPPYLKWIGDTVPEKN